MGGQLSLAAKILLGRDEAAAEVHAPDAIHHDARGERVAAVRQPARQAEPVARLVLREGRQTGGRVARHDLAWRVVPAALEQMRRPRLTHFLHDHDLRHERDERVLLLAKAPEVGTRRDVRLMVPDEEVLECGGVSRIASNRRDDLCRRQARIEHQQIVDQPVLEPAVAEAGADGERMLRRQAIRGCRAVADVLVQVIADHVGLEPPAVEIEADAGRAARSVVGHHEPGPLVQGQRSLRPHRDRVAGPEMNEAEERAPAVEGELEAAAARVRPRARLVHDDGAILPHGGLEPQAE